MPEPCPAGDKFPARLYAQLRDGPSNLEELCAELEACRLQFGGCVAPHALGPTACEPPAPSGSRDLAAGTGPAPRWRRRRVAAPGHHDGGSTRVRPWPRHRTPWRAGPCPESAAAARMTCAPALRSEQNHIQALSTTPTPSARFGPCLARPRLLRLRSGGGSPSNDSPETARNHAGSGPSEPSVNARARRRWTPSRDCT